jgi:hypothetical protein
MVLGHDLWQHDQPEQDAVNAQIRADTAARSACNDLELVMGKAEAALANRHLSAVWRDRLEQAAARVGLLQYRKA